MNGTEIIALLRDNLPTVISSVGSITGSLITAIFLRFNTASSEFEKIKSGHFNEVIDSLLKSGKMTYTEYYKANNFLQIAEKADEYYKDINLNQSTEPYDFDWFVNFYETVGNISDEDMQILWAKILAGEISKTASFSLKTIDVLKNLSKKDAELFENICLYSFKLGSNQIFLPHNDKYLKQYGIQYTSIMKMSELGLLFNNSSISLNVNVSLEPRILFINNELLMTVASNNEKEFTEHIQEYPFTAAGIEIASIINKFASDECLITYGKCLTDSNSNRKFAIHRIVNRTEDDIEYERENLLEDN